jgi:hypothetical protein
MALQCAAQVMLPAAGSASGAEELTVLLVINGVVGANARVFGQTVSARTMEPTVVKASFASPNYQIGK